MFKKISEHLFARWYDYLLTSYSLLLPEDFYTATGVDKKVEKQSDAFKRYRTVLMSYTSVLGKIRRRGSTGIRTLQNIRLRRIIGIANTIPFWEERFKRLDIAPQDIRTLADLVKIPPVTRSELKAVEHSSLVSSFETNAERIQRNKTAGTTTGVPFVVLFPRSVALINVASHYFGILHSHGVNVKRLSERDFILAFNMFGGERPVSTIPEQFVSYAWIGRTADSAADLDAFLRTAATLGEFVLMTHPTELFFLVQKLKEKNIKLNVRLCLVIGQLLEPSVRRAAEMYFRARVVSVYGLREYMLSGEECPRGQNQFHMQAERNYIEILNDEGSPVPVGEFGQVTFTGLDNPLMPLIRYQSGDSARLIEGECACGNPNQLFELEQRTSDVFEFPDGTFRGIKAISQALMSEPFVSGIVRYQIRQEELTRIVVLVVLSEHADHGAITETLPGVLAKTIRAPQEVQVIVKPVDDIASEGKYKPFISLATVRTSTATKQ